MMTNSSNSRKLTRHLETSHKTRCSLAPNANPKIKHTLTDPPDQFIKSDDLEGTLDAVENNVERLCNQNNHAQARIEKLSKELDQANRANAELTHELQKARQRIDELEWQISKQENECIEK